MDKIEIFDRMKTLDMIEMQMILEVEIVLPVAVRRNSLIVLFTIFGLGWVLSSTRFTLKSEYI